MMRKTFLIGILTIFLFCGCQKTPEDPIVVKKSEAVIENMIEDSKLEDNIDKNSIDNKSIIPPINENYEYPRKYKTQVIKYNNKFEMVIDADIKVTHTDYYPIVQISPYYIPIEQVDKFILSIFGSLNIPLATTNLTKDEIMDVIVQVKSDINNAEECNNNDKKEELEVTLNLLYEEYETAPEIAEVQFYESKYNIEEHNNHIRHYINVRKNPEDKHSPVIQVSIDVYNPQSNGFNTEMTYQDVYREIFSYDYEGENRLKFYDNPIFKTEQASEAISLAKEFLNRIGIEDRVLESMIPRAASEGSSDIIGYALIFGKKYNDIVIPPLVQFGGTTANRNFSNDEDYIQSYSSEYLRIEVENNEIVEFFWESPYEINKVLIDDIKLMPFDEIMKNIENQLAVKYSYLEDREVKFSLYVDEIILTYAVERIKDKTNEFMLIPVWAFYGGYDYGEGQKTVNGRFLEGKYIEQASLITINAVDGTVITGR